MLWDMSGLADSFSLDYQRMNNDQPQILIYKLVQVKFYISQSNFYQFMKRSNRKNEDACFASSFFSEWYNGSKINLKHDQCVGYKVPLYLNGEDDLEKS
jgi:hypothetical protein